MSIEYKNIKVTKKTGRCPKYKYEGTVDVYDKVNHVFKNIFTIRRWVNKKFIRDTYLDDLYFDDEYINYRKGKEVIQEIKQQGELLKSEDDCCITPDLELCNTYPLHDIILCYILDRDDMEVLDYCFKRKDENTSSYPESVITYRDENSVRYDTKIIVYHQGHITFKYLGKKYCYGLNIGKKIKEYACLVCKACDRSEEEKAIEEFKEWLEEEVMLQERKSLAKEICGCETNS